MATRQDSQGNQNAGNFVNDRERASEAGRKGGQHSGSTHGNETGRQGGQGGSGNFANDRERASEAGKKGGQMSHGNGQQRDDKR